MGMKAVDIYKHIDWEQLSEAEKKALKKKLLDHKAHLSKSLEAIEKALAIAAEPANDESPVSPEDKPLEPSKDESPVSPEDKPAEPSKDESPVRGKSPAKSRAAKPRR
jgi:hypothetical protein